MGKGSNPRPFDIPRDEFAANFDRIFGRKEPRKTHEPQDNKEPKPDDKKDTK